MKITPLYTTALFILFLAMLSGCQMSVAAPPASEIATEPDHAAQSAVANPASENCVEQGGKLLLEERGDGGQFGVCYFEDNRQCEEWALLRGDCPLGGVKVTGYITPAARYCAITGGTYTITGNGGAEDEQGTCTFPDGTLCDAWDYYNGDCLPGNSLPAGQMRTITNKEAGFTLQVPSNWTETILPDQNDGMMHGEAFAGPQGGVEVYWGAGFGGACPAGYTTVLLAQGEAQNCYTKRDDGTELWEQISYQVEGGNSYSSRAYTSDAEPASHDLLLQVLSTLAFMMPEQPYEGQAIQPLSMELCNGQAQAMSHFLNDLIPTVTEQPLSDPVTGASGTGCQAMITGTGEQFESPQAVVDTLGSMLEEQGWIEDPLLAAGGPMGAGEGYRKDDQICLANAMWVPDESANCPDDQPISTCQVTPEQQLYTVTLNCGVETAEGQAGVDVGSNMLVFDSTRGGDYRDLYLMDNNGRNMSRLTRGEANSFAGPWSPDGQRIVYTSYDGGVTETYIAVINADGSGKTIIDQINGSDEGFPDWSPDGSLIAFTSRRDGNNEIYVMNADGSNPVRLTDHPGDDFAPSWSSDGTQIVFVSDRNQTAGVTDLYIMKADGSGVTRLTDDAFLDYSPDWSPDGQKIAFRSDRDEESDIYVINVDGSGETRLTEDPTYDWSPQWSPDGRYIAFQTDRDGNFEIYRMAPDGSDVVNLTNDPGDDQMPFWRP